MTTETFKFKKGEVYALDTIYDIQGLGGGDWWEHQGGETGSDNVEITRSIEIKISIKF